MEFLFRTSAYDAKTLVPQASRALEAYSERLSRKKLPQVWNWRDRISEKKQPAEKIQEKKKKLQKAEGVVFLLLGFFLLVPGLMAPESPELLAVGMGAAGFGCLCLWTGRKKCRLSQNERDRLFSLAWAAGMLLFFPGLLMPLEPFYIASWIFYMGAGGAAVWWKHERKNSRFDKAAQTLLSWYIDMPLMEVCFGAEGMQVADSETVPYSDFSYIMETEDLYLFIWREQITVLQKKDLPQEGRAAFLGFLSERLGAAEILHCGETG